MLDNLVAVIETLKSRIKDHGADLQSNETRTRMSLIDPLLTVLGWDVSDPELVTPEYDVNGKRADYALLDGQRPPVVFLEAKRLGEQLTNHRTQVLVYARELGIRYPALTNGNDWEVYDNSIMAPIEKCLVLNVSISKAPTAACALQLLLLWRPNLASGAPTPASKPILVPEQRSSAPVPSQVSPAPTMKVPTASMPTAGDSGWTALADFQAEKGAKAPARMRLPSGEESAIHRWRNILAGVAEWLIKNGDLTPSKCPIKMGRLRYMVHTKAIHSEGAPFASVWQLSNGLFLEANLSSPAIVSNACSLMEQLGRDPKQVHLQSG